MDNQYLRRDETSAKYCNRMTKGITHRFIENLLTEIRLLVPETILDVGCGTGYITNIMANELKSTIIGCDVNTNRISFANANFGQEVVLADVKRLPFKDSSFDIVVASEIIEHIPRVDEVLLEIRRVAKKNAIITVPNEPYFRIANFLRGKNVRRFGNPPDHVNHYTKRSIKRLLEEYFLNLNVKTNAMFWIIATMGCVVCE